MLKCFAGMLILAVSTLRLPVSALSLLQDACVSWKSLLHATYIFEDQLFLSDFQMTE